MIRASRHDLGGGSDELEPVLDLVREATGLMLPARTVPLGTVRREMLKAGRSNAEDYARLLARRGASFDALVSALTVGEKFFLREREQLDFIAREVLPELARTARGRTPTAWSAGCAQGEEAYSLAIVAESADCPLQVVGTDISRHRLEGARAAAYGEWSFRGVSADVRARYFRRSGGGFEPLPEIKSRVEFRVLNLAADDWSVTAEFQPFDLVLCRNTLIYLDSPTVTRVARRLLDTLSPSGWLFLGASDPLLSGLVPCEVVLTGAGVAYRRPQRARGLPIRQAVAEPAPPKPAAVPFIAERRRNSAPVPEHRAAARVTPPVMGASEPDGLQSAYAAGDYQAVADRARRRVELEPGDAEGWVLLVRALANLGRMDEAGRACASAHDLHRNNAELAYLHGLLLREGGRIDEAVAALRAAIYLDRQLVIAHLTLGDVLAALGDTTTAMRAFRNADRLLSRVRADDVVAATDGLRADTLAQLTSGRLQYWEVRPQSPVANA